MKFYFCETCGKRLTDAEISAGQGRDKKLRGVYCAACAQGVMTMENLPMTEGEAQALLVQESSAERPAARRASGAHALPAAAAHPPSSAAHRIPTGVHPPSSAAHRIPTAAAARVRGHSSAVAPHRPPPAPASSTPMLLLGVGGAGVLLVLILLFSGGGKPAAAPKAPAATPPVTVVAPTPVARPQPSSAVAKTVDTAALPPRPEPGTPATPDAPPQPELNREQLAQAALDQVMRFEGLAPDDKDGRVQRLNAFAQEYADTIVSARARREVTRLTAPPEPPPTAEPAPAPAAAALVLPEGGEWTPLFNGQDLTGWAYGQNSNGEVEVKDGCIVKKPSDRSSNIQCALPDGNFEVTLQIFLSRGERRGNIDINTGAGSAITEVDRHGFPADKWVDAKLTVHQGQMQIVVNGQTELSQAIPEGKKPGPLNLWFRQGNQVQKVRDLKIRKLP
ncbi:MAG: hypothetical protein HS116_11870 [Planctomycetes bacterium]|nr:hypothetical protein [Planctomycetota bacterium]